MSDRIEELAQKHFPWADDLSLHQKCEYALRELDAEHEKERATDALEWKKEFEKRNQFAAEKDAEIAELKNQLATERGFFENIPHALLCKAWDRTIDRVPGLGRVVSIGGFEELSEQLGIAKQNFNSDAYTIIERSLLEEARKVLHGIIFASTDEEEYAAVEDAHKLLTKLGHE